MSLKDTLTDRAVAVAKRHSHHEVTPAHVTFAVLEYYLPPRGSVDKAAVDAARDRLPAPGTAVKPPEVSPDAADLLAHCTNDDDALRSVMSNLDAQPDSAGESPTIAPGQAAKRKPDATPDKPLADVLSEALADLDSLIGLATVKERVRELVAMQQFNTVREQEGLPKVGTGLNLVFTGDPGTGKTTVARIVARIYKGLGLLGSGHLVETGRVDLVGGYVGQTAIKTQEAIERAKGGVLFIDEAYALAPRHEADFGAEAISTLVKAMEDRRGTLAVIAAGYTDEMELFVESNPGLRSRFQTFIDFPNYTDDELVEIFADLAERNKVTASPEVLAAVRASIATADTDDSGGNARFVRGMFEAMTSRMAMRAAADGKVEAHEVVAFDVADIPRHITARRGSIGFTR